MTPAGTTVDATAPDGTSGPGEDLAQASQGAGASVRGRSEPVTLAQSLMSRAGWSAANFGTDGPNPPYLRIGGKLWVTLSEYEPCFASMRRDRGLFRSKVSIAGHLERYDEIMIDPIAFDDRYGAGEGRETNFPFGAWLAIRGVGFEGIALWGRRQGSVTLPLAPLAVASAIWLREADPSRPHDRA